MNSKIDFVVVNTQRPSYSHTKSRWYGKASPDKKFRLVFSFYSPDGNQIAMPIASMSAYLKRDFPWVDVILEPILIASDAARYTPENYADSISELRPDLIAFSVMSPHWYPMEPYFARLKEMLPELPICIGGYQAMLSQEQTIENPNVDFICVGDGEYAIGNLVQFLRGSKEGPVDGMWEKLADGEIYKTDAHQIGDLTALPFPDYDIFAKDGDFTGVGTSVFGPKEKLILPVMTGRGCPYRCTYCCNTPLLEGWKSKKEFLRKYDPLEMVNELIRLRDRYNVEYFEFWDELFLSNLKFVNAFFEIYKEKIRLPFSINSRVEVMNERFCNSAAEAGCHTIWFGIESGDEKYRTTMLGRKMTNQQIIDAADNCKKAGINRLTFNIVGMPLETAENMRNTLELNRRVAPEFFFFFPYIPLRGTPLYQRAEAENLLITKVKKNLHYLSAANDRQFTLNLKERPDLLTEAQYAEICREMLLFQESNNRLSFVDPVRQDGGSDSVSDTEKRVPDSVAPATDIATTSLVEFADQTCETELLDLFRATFGHEMSAELWRWKYRNYYPQGTLLRWQGSPVAFYGGMPRNVQLFGTPATAVQIGDVMVHPKVRSTLARKGPFFRVAANFLERFVGHGKEFPIAFGFPSARAFRLGEHLGLYEKVGEIMRVSWPALHARPSVKVSLRRLSLDQGEIVDRLWQEMAEALPDQIVGVRDWAYLQYRYLKHPTQSYQLYLAATRWGGVPLGVLVVRVHDDAVELLDIVSAPKHIHILVHYLRKLAWNLEKPSTYAWITEQHASLLAGGDGDISPTGITIPHNHWTPGISASELKNRWWLMGGDTDFR
ncbi:MAG: GNAT family N-acetyltransferase [Methylomonas sp.]|nr:GNAT family N-acetyltransferase [Methylomonas sp.]